MVADEATDKAGSRRTLVIGIIVVLGALLLLTPVCLIGGLTLLGNYLDAQFTDIAEQMESP